MDNTLVMWLASDEFHLSFDKIDAEQAFEFLTKHRLEGRILRKIYKCKVDKSSSILVKRLIDKFDKIRKLTLLQLDFLEVLQSNKHATNKPLFIKGASCALLLNDEYKIRFSGDIDLFYADICSLKKILCKKKLNKLDFFAAQHEDSLYKHPQTDLYVDVHKYFPVLSKPILPKNVRSRKQLDLADIQIAKITYDDLLQNVVEINNDIASNLLVTNPEMTALLLALHMYKDLFWEPYKTPPVRLYEAFEIVDLISLPSFDFDKFKKICVMKDAGFAVDYIFRIIEAVFRCDLPKIEPTSDENEVIVKLMNDDFSPYYISGADYYGKIPFLTFDDIIENIEGSFCRTNEIYSTKNMTEPYYASTNYAIIDFDFKISETENTIDFEFKVDGSVENGANFFVKIENDFSHVWFDRYPDSIRVYGNRAYALKLESEFYTVKISVEKKINNTAVIAVGKSNSDEKCVTVVPLKLI